jgi:hypothetical protein
MEGGWYIVRTQKYGFFSFFLFISVGAEQCTTRQTIKKYCPTARAERAGEGI